MFLGQLVKWHLTSWSCMPKPKPTQTRQPAALLNLADMARFLKISPTTARHAARQSGFPTGLVLGRRRYWHRVDVALYIAPKTTR